MDATNELTVAQNAIAALQAPDVFGLVQALLLAAANPKASQAATAALKRQAESIAADRAQLDADRAAFASYEAGVRAELAKEESRASEEARIVQKSKDDWITRITQVEAWMKQHAETAYARTYETLPGGLTRQRDLSAMPGDVHYAKAVPDPKFGAELAESDNADGKRVDPRAGTNNDPFPPHTTITRGAGTRPRHA